MSDKKTLVAISISSDLNTDSKKVFETFEKEEKIYFAMPTNMIEADVPLYTSRIHNYFKGLKKSIKVDVDSFASFKNENLKRCSLVVNLICAMKFFEKDPFTMKTKDINEYNHELVYSDEHSECVRKALNIAESQFFCRRLQDTPSDIINPITFVENVIKEFEQVKDKVTIRVMDKKELEEKGMNLILAVNKGSVIEPRFMTIEYRNSSSNELYAYVGKGITYDSGGMSLKPSSAMRWMKYDMSGAAIVASTVLALAKNSVQTNVVAVIPLTENMLSPTAVRPDDIVKSYSGLTVEIDNTDAEGRLILADALTYASKDLKATKIFDVATLTGAMVFSLGDTFSGCWSTSDLDWKLVNKSANRGGEFVWRLPFHEDFLKPLKSDLADFKNSSNDRNAGSSRAACFLKEFTLGTNYVHFDVAATADKNDRGQGVLIKTLYRIALDSFNEH